MKTLSTMFMLLCMLTVLASAGSSFTKTDESIPTSTRNASDAFIPPAFEVVEVGYSYATMKVTDYSDDDYRYILSENGVVILSDIELPGVFGDHFIFTDNLGGTTYTYSLSVLLDDMVTVLENVASVTFTTPLEAPQLSQHTFPLTECGSYIELDIGAFDGTAGIEIYRALSADGPYGLIKSSTPAIYHYLDDVKPATTFFYKVRAFRGEVYSEFSNVIEATSELDYYWPTFSATWNGSGVDITFTDRTYADTYYRVERLEITTGIATVLYHETLADSGQVVSFTDNGLLPNEWYEYYLFGESTLTCGVPNAGENELARVALFTGSGSVPAPQLSEHTPRIECGSFNELDIAVTDPGTSIEIYRSLSADGPYGVVASSFSPDQVFIDDVKPATTFFYKARASKDGIYSEFSNVLALTSDQDYYWPDFTVDWKGNGVEITLKDNTYADAFYRITKVDENASSTTELLFHDILADSGQTITLMDYYAKPFSVYRYTLYGNSTLDCGSPPSEGEYIILQYQLMTGGIPDYFINRITLVDPTTGEEIGQLLDGALVDGRQAPIIRAHTDGKTKAVMFFLNNKRHADNGPPVFTYQPGLVQPGHYVLTATPSSEKNGKGIVGETVTIEFDVENYDYHVNWFTLIDPVTQEEIGDLWEGSVVDISASPQIRAHATPKTNAVMFFLNNKRHTDNGPPVFTYKPGITQPGHYVLKAIPSSDKNATGIVGTPTIIEFDAICRGCTTMARIPEREEEETPLQKGVSLYPNPVVSESALRVDATPGSKIKVQVTDEFGRMKMREINASADTSGVWIQPVQELKLGRGIYMMHVTIDGARYVKRFVVN